MVWGNRKCVAAWGRGDPGFPSAVMEIHQSVGTAVCVSGPGAAEAAVLSAGSSTLTRLLREVAQAEAARRGVAGSSPAGPCGGPANCPPPAAELGFGPLPHGFTSSRSTWGWSQALNQWAGSKGQSDADASFPQAMRCGLPEL